LTLCFPIGFHFLAYPNLFGIKGFVVVVVVVVYLHRISFGVLRFLGRDDAFVTVCQQKLERFPSGTNNENRKVK
jgi:hypothetical protein